ncbi:hypothetical protein [Neobacillus sp. D3-1R]|uniref:hypothetical protein n=1 Tax=Neobacillus sp. D3-1R TaxID=3445778 RepID=UPI003F9ED117
MFHLFKRAKQWVGNLQLQKPILKKQTKKKLLSILNLLSTTMLYVQNKINKIISDNIHMTLIVLYLLFIIIYFIIPPITQPASESLKHLINHILLSTGFEGFGDATIRYIIITITNLLVTVLSILSAMYVFTHREQKSISPSLYNETKKNGLVVLVVLIVVFTMITGHTLASNIDSLMQQKDYKSYNPLHVTKMLIIRISIWTAGIIFAVIFVIELIKYLFLSMNADKMLKKSIKLVSRYLDVLTGFYRTKMFDNFLNERYKALHHNVESIFQYLKFLGDNNMNRDFDENIDSLSLVINKLKNFHKKLGDENVSSHLLKRDNEHFLGIYNSLLRNTLSLTLHLYKNNHFNKGKKLSDLYFSIYLDGEDSLKQHFTLSLNEYLDSLDPSNERQLKHFLSGLKNLPEDSTLIIYKNLIQRLIFKGNLGLLTNVVYDFKEHIIEGVNRTKPKLNPMFKAIAAQNQIKMKKNAIIILLQLLVKAIEISQYGTAGFLAKYMVTNFNGEEINESYRSLRQNPTSFTSILESSEDNKIKEDDQEISLVGLNAETIDYCCKKMWILLYGQQQFAIKEKLWFIRDNNSFNEPINLEMEFNGCPYSNYVMKKVQSASSKYGMLFFNDQKIMMDIYQKLNIEHHYPIESKQPQFS